MATWNTDELDRIGAAEEVRIAARRPNGRLRTPVVVWIVRVNWKGHGFPMRSPEAWTKHFTAVQHSLSLQAQFSREQAARHTGNSPRSRT